MQRLDKLRLWLFEKRRPVKVFVCFAIQSIVRVIFSRFHERYKMTFSFVELSAVDQVDLILQILLMIPFYRTIEKRAFKRNGNEYGNTRRLFNLDVDYVHTILKGSSYAGTKIISDRTSFKHKNSKFGAIIFLLGGGVLPHKRLMGMCRWMGSHFHDCNGVAFSEEVLLMGSHIF